MQGVPDACAYISEANGGEQISVCTYIQILALAFQPARRLDVESHL